MFIDVFARCESNRASLSKSAIDRSMHAVCSMQSIISADENGVCRVVVANIWMVESVASRENENGANRGFDKRATAICKKI